MLVFSRVPTTHIDELMQEPELVLGLIQDMGFSLDEEPDTNTMLALLESRWQGNEQNYSLEEFSTIAQNILLEVLETTTLTLLFKGGKKSSISSQDTPIHVLSPNEVHLIQGQLAQIDLITLQTAWMDMDKVRKILPEAQPQDVDTFWMLFPGLFQFFQTASQQDECILRSSILDTRLIEN